MVLAIVALRTNALDISAWLRELRLERYDHAFQENEIDAEILSNLTADDLKDIGVTAVGHRRKLLKAIAALAEPESALQAESNADAAEPERRRLTVLFCDLVGSTALASQLDPEDMRIALTSYQDAVAGQIARFEGFVAKFMGDGVLAYFGYPRAHEDDAELAVRGGLALVNAISKLTAPNGDTLAARVGISTGLVVVGDLVGQGAAQEQAVVGETPNLAARLQAIAEPGQVVIAEETRRLLGANIIVEELGERSLKGIKSPIGVYAVTGERALASRFEARAGTPLPMVGRDQELALLRDRWARAKADEGQCVLLVGEAGIGKSRIARAMLDDLAEESHFRVRYQCSPHHSGSALWPVMQQLTYAAEIDADDVSEARLDKLECLLVRSRIDDDTHALIADLVGIDATARYGRIELTPQAKRTRTLEVLVRQLLSLASRQPLLVVLEDAHWIDPTTLELIELCLEQIVDCQILILITSRPENEPELAAHRHITRLTLSRLGRKDVEAIAMRLSDERLPIETIDEIVARADGVPLFVEELTRAVSVTGDATVPASLHDSLVARLDRAPNDKKIAQIAACIGRDFDARMLVAVSARDEKEVESALSRLVKAGLLIRRGARSENMFRFKHALLCDAAYASMLISRRRVLHREVLAAYAKSSNKVPPEILARHWHLAGDDERAAASFAEAGRLAEAQSATTEAAWHYRAALDLLHKLSTEHHTSSFALELWQGLCRTLLLARGHIADEIVDVHERTKSLALALGHQPAMFRSTLGLYFHFQAIGDYKKALRLSNELMTIAESEGLSQYIVAATRARGAIELYSGHFVQAYDTLSRAISEYEKSGAFDAQPGVALNPYLGAHHTRNACSVILGFVDTAKVGLEEQLKHTNGGVQAPDKASALALGAASFFLLGDRPRARQLAQELLSIARQHGLGMYQLLGEAQAAPEEFTWRHLMDKNVPTMMAAVVILMRVSDRSGLRDNATIGDAREALEALNESGVRWMSAEIGRMLAHADLARGHIDMAMTKLGSAAKLAHSQGALWFELRALRDLVRLQVEQGEHEPDFDWLEKALMRLSEGHNLPDVAESTALLNASR